MCIRDSTNTALQRLLDRGVRILFNLFNICFQFAYFPLKCRKSTVTIIPKLGKDLKFAEKLPPISLQSSTSKRYQTTGTVAAIRSPKSVRHFGLRAILFSSRPLLNTSVDAIRGDRGRCRLLAGTDRHSFLDVKKAFDCAWHPHLLHKLTEILLPD